MVQFFQHLNPRTLVTAGFQRPADRPRVLGRSHLDVLFAKQSQDGNLERGQIRRRVVTQEVQVPGRGDRHHVLIDGSCRQILPAQYQRQRLVQLRPQLVLRHTGESGGEDLPQRRDAFFHRLRNVRLPLHRLPVLRHENLFAGNPRPGEQHKIRDGVALSGRHHPGRGPLAMPENTNVLSIHLRALG